MGSSTERGAAGNGRPVYRQIAERIQQEIESGRRADGEQLPTIRALARELGVNRDTVARAYEELAAAGLLEATVGRGSFVRSRAAAAAASHLDAPLSPAVLGLLDLERARPRYGFAGDAVPLHSLLPDPALYPVEGFRRALARVMADQGAELLRYGVPQGHPGLREELAARLRAVGVEAEAHELALTQGASEGIQLALRLYCATGDAVAVEEPTYHHVLTALTALGLHAVPIPLGEDGPDLAALEEALARPEVKLFYTMPSFHNPMGTSTSLAQRRALLALAARQRKPVIEDAYEMDLRYAGRPVPSLAALDRARLVSQLVSFSKSLFPGLRVGAILARGRALDGVIALKQTTDLGGSFLLQAALAEFLRRGEYDRHLARVRRALLARRDALLEALAREMPEGTRWTTPEGGLQLWVELPGGIDTAELLPEAGRAGVLFAPGFQFRHDGRPSSGMRVSFALADEEAIRRGVAALGKVVRERLARGGVSLREHSVNL